MNSRLAELLCHTTLSPARRIFAMQQIVDRARLLGRADLCERIYPLLEQEVLRLRNQHRLNLYSEDLHASNQDGQARFSMLVAEIATEEPAPQAEQLLEPVIHQITRLKEFENRPYSSAAASLR
jgi:hypothetical protein